MSRSITEKGLQAIWDSIDIFLFFPHFKNLGQAADEIFRVAAWTCSEVFVTRGFCVGQVDAEKLA
jgi:hypothetical protein